MRVRHVAFGLLLASGCRTCRDCGEVKETIWAHLEPGQEWPGDFADRYSPYYDPRRFNVYLWRAGRDDEVLLFATRVTSGGLFGGIAGTAWRDKDVVGYTPTGRVGSERTAHGRGWREYRLLGGPSESRRVADAISKQRVGRLDRPR